MDERNLLKIIADNPTLLELLRKILEEQFSFDESVKESTTLTNEILGQNVRACLVAKGGIKNAFDYISRLKTVPEKPEVKNPAR